MKPDSPASKACLPIEEASALATRSFLPGERKLGFAVASQHLRRRRRHGTLERLELAPQELRPRIQGLVIILSILCFVIKSPSFDYFYRAVS